MNPLKKLFGQTAVYGLGTVVPRVLNYLLFTPIFTRLFYDKEYGAFSELAAYMAILLVILTYGMETTFFRFSSTESDKNKVYSTAFISLLTTSSIFILITVLFTQPLANAIQYPHNSNYIIWIGAILAIDAFTSIPFAKLREQNKAKKFALLKGINVAAIIGLNCFFFREKLLAEFPKEINVDIEYIFIANFIASALMLILLIPELVKVKFVFDLKLYKRMLAYGWPLMIVGIAGIFNETGDKIILKYLLTGDDNLAEVGIYAANYRIAVLMTIFIQMFRYAAEPFFFSYANEKNSKEVYAKVMKFFVIFGLLIFLGVMLYIDVVKFFIDTEFHAGLYIVPVVLLANLFLGIYYNLSIWYKLTNKTIYGAVMSIIGLSITLVLNITLIPIIGYIGSAWATFFCYLSMMLISYFWGRNKFPVNYDLKSIIGYSALAIALFFTSKYLNIENTSLHYVINTIFFLGFFILVIFIERKSLFVKRV